MSDQGPRATICPICGRHSIDLEKRIEWKCVKTGQKFKWFEYFSIIKHQYRYEGKEQKR